jgi:4-hydroxy-3-polyprenylbenzoate decarboxylase
MTAPPVFALDEIALFLDFDGTLVELAPQPEAVIVPPELPALLARLHDRMKGAAATISGRPIAEIDGFLAPVKLPASGAHGADDLAAPVSSGSFQTMGMIVAPCSVKTLAEIATGVTTTLISRAADVALKERRRVVLLLRETPLHLGHIKSMAAVTEAGAIVYPPVPAFYTRPTSLEDMVDHTLGRVLDLFGIELNLVRRWTGDIRHPNAAAKAPR